MNPTIQDILNIADQSKLNTVLQALELQVVSDARLAAREIIEKLYLAYAAIPQATLPVTYSVTKNTRNADINTQTQTYTFVFQMAISTFNVDDEPQVEPDQPEV